MKNMHMLSTTIHKRVIFKAEQTVPDKWVAFTFEYWMFFTMIRVCNVLQWNKTDFPIIQIFQKLIYLHLWKFLINHRNKHKSWAEVDDFIYCDIFGAKMPNTYSDFMTKKISLTRLCIIKDISLLNVHYCGHAKSELK